MENAMFMSVPEDMVNHVHDPDTSYAFPTSLIESAGYDLNSRDQVVAGFPLLSALHGDGMNDFRAGIPASGGGTQTPIPCASTLLTRNGLREDLANFAASPSSALPSDVLSSFPEETGDAQNSSFPTPLHDVYDRFVGENTNCLDFYKFPNPLLLPGSSQFDNASSEQGYSSKYCNELSLSLANQCSEITRSGCLNERGLGSEHISCNSKDLSLSVGSYSPDQFSPVLSGSRYQNVIQRILAQVATYSLEYLDLDHDRTATPADISEERSPDMTGHVQQRKEAEAKKAQLLTLLQLVDDRYNQCLDEIHTVVSAFHAATELDPRVHVCFALHTISSFYKSLRERISNQILSLGACVSDGGGGGSGCGSGSGSREERSPEGSCIQSQWALEQLKRRDQQLWRPQRGLPERSVAVLRAWMFQNFLHPYPKDTEKHLLAVKSGLTRSQVSNWFINARVRLWKPLIEEMYSEMNRRNGRPEGGGNRDHRRQGSGGGQRLDMN